MNQREAIETLAKWLLPKTRRVQKSFGDSADVIYADAESLAAARLEYVRMVSEQAAGMCANTENRFAASMITEHAEEQVHEIIARLTQEGS